MTIGRHGFQAGDAPLNDAIIVATAVQPWPGYFDAIDANAGSVLQPSLI